jgi:adenylate kinase
VAPWHGQQGLQLMRIVLLGAPGSGKGTQATRLKEALGVAHISTGDLLRAQVAAGTDLGRAAKAVMEAGQLVSDDIVLGMLEARLGEADTARGFILDGYPRNLAQAEALDRLLIRIGQPLEHVVQLDVDEELLFQRLAGRAAAEGRKDDNPETVRQRLAVYGAQTAPVIDFYAARGALQRVDGVGAVEEVLRRILGALGVPGT